MTSPWLAHAAREASDPLRPGTAYDAVVIGAGITGLVSAVLLARAGRTVAVLERRQVGAVTTGNTTAKISLLQGTTFSRVRRYHSGKVAVAYPNANRDAFDWLLNALAFSVPGVIPRGMYLSADQPTRSLRTAPYGGEELLLVGGNGHPVGRHSQPPSALARDLRDWTEQRFPGARQRFVWSAQDCASHNGVPFVGKLPRGSGKVFVATGYSKWGMTNAVAAALRLCDELTGAPPRAWVRTLGARVTKPAAAGRSAGANLAIGAAAVLGWTGAELRPLKTRIGGRQRAEALSVGSAPARLRCRPSTVARALSARCVPIWAGCCGTTTSSDHGTVRCTGHGSGPTGRFSKGRPATRPLAQQGAV